MLSAKKTRTVVGLDIEAGSLGAAELSVNGSTSIVSTAIAPLEAGVFREGEVTDPEALAGALGSFFSDNKLGKSVRLGLANQRVAVRMLTLPPVDDPKEIEAAVRFQAQDHIPMPLDQAVLDYQIVDSVQAPDGDAQRVAVAVAARRDMVTKTLGALRDAGLRPVGFDLSAFGMIRALWRQAGQAPVDSSAGNEGPPARLYCNLGDVTNLAVARGPNCVFTRVSTFGVEGVAQRLAERSKLTLEHARQWLGHVGLERPIEQIQGDPEIVAATREALDEGATKLVEELRLSLEFYGAQEGVVPVSSVIVCGPGSTIPGLVSQLQVDLGAPFEIGRPNALAGFDDASAARLTLAYGLGLEN